MGWVSQTLVVSGPPVATGLSTTFPATENPISQGGLWTLGGTTGLDWQDVQTTGGSPGIAYGVGASAGFNDCIAIVKGRVSTTKHRSTITVSKTAGYTPPSSHEIEVLVGFDITANVAKGYEMDIPFGSSVGPVRWNGAISDFDTTVFTTVSGATFSVADGDVVDVVFDSSTGSPVMTLSLNGVVTWVITDTTAGKILSGAPGMGFFARAGAGLDMTKYCVKGWNGASA